MERETTESDDVVIKLVGKNRDLQKENEELKYWKESEIKLWLPVIEYMQKNPLLKPGDSISTQTLKFLKAYTEIVIAINSKFNPWKPLTK